MTSKAIVAAFSVVAAALALKASAPASAQAAPPEPAMKIGMVNLEECFDKEKYNYIKDVNGELEGMRAEMAKEVDALTKRFNDLSEQIKGLSDQKKSMLYQEKVQQAKELDALIEVKSKYFQAKLKAAKLAKWTEVYSEICRVVKVVAVEGKFDLVFREEEPMLDDDSTEVALQRINSRVVLYADAKYDITKKVIERLNQEYAKKKSGAPVTPPKNP